MKCSGSGSWSEPWAEAGYDVQRIEIHCGEDVRLLEYPDKPVYGVLAAPPCTHLCIAGAESWERKGDGPLLEGLEVVGACIRFAVFCRASFWALENPAGRLRKYLGPPQMVFHPSDYGDPWTKLTNIWGSFKMPTPAVVDPWRGSIMDFANTSAERSITPAGFANAFYEANKAAWWDGPLTSRADQMTSPWQRSFGLRSAVGSSMDDA